MDAGNKYHPFAQSAASLAAAANALALAAQALSEAAQALSNINLGTNKIPATAQLPSNEYTLVPQQAPRDTAERNQTSATNGNARNNVLHNNLANGGSDESSESEGEYHSHAGSSRAWPSGDSFNHLNSPWATPNPLIGVSGGAIMSQPSSHWYIPLQEDFDAIPLIYYLYGKHPKSVCFIAHSKNATPHTAILNKISPSLPIVRAPHKQTSTARAIEKLKTSKSTLLLLRGNHVAPASLPGIQLDSIIHWGLPPGDSFFSQIRSAKASNTYLLLPLNEQSPTTIHTLTTNNILKHPESAQLNKSDRSSPLDLLRSQTREGLSSIQPGVLIKAYDDHLRARLKEHYSVIEAAQLANKFSARVLLRGWPTDGNQTYTPIGPALPVKAKLVGKCRLEPAVEQGLLQVI